MAMCPHTRLTGLVLVLLRAVLVVDHDILLQLVLVKHPPAVVRLHLVGRWEVEVVVRLEVP